MGCEKIERGYVKLYKKLRYCDDENLHTVMLGLSENDINRICDCICQYLIGNLKVETDNMCHILDVDRYINKDLIDLVSDRYTIEEKRNFLSNSVGCQGYNVANLVCCHLLPNLIASFPEAKEIRDNECLKLKEELKN